MIGRLCQVLMKKKKILAIYVCKYRSKHILLRVTKNKPKNQIYTTLYFYGRKFYVTNELIVAPRNTKIRFFGTGINKWEIQCLIPGIEKILSEVKQ